MNLNPFRRAVAPTIPMHQPQRADGETREQYKARREASRDAVERATLTGFYAPGGESTRQKRRNALRTSGRMKFFAGKFGDGLRNNIARKSLHAIRSRTIA